MYYFCHPLTERSSSPSSTQTVLVSRMLTHPISEKITDIANDNSSDLSLMIYMIQKAFHIPNISHGGAL